MSHHVPVTPAEWRDFLSSYSDDYLRLADEKEVADLDKVQRESRWLGYEPASVDAIHATEERLGISLPPGYRNFLLASNGWRDIDPELSELLKVDELGWFPEKEPELLRAWAEIEDVAEQVKPCLLLSGPTDCAVYWLLDPTKIDQDGEWTAYEWAPGDGSDPSPYPSFGALVASAREVFNQWKTQGVIKKVPYADGRGASLPVGGASTVHNQATASDTWPSRGISPLRIDRLDHLALTVADQDATIDFYTRVLGMEAITFGEAGMALTFGHSVIRLRVAGQDPDDAKAAKPVSGSVELCFVVDDPLLLLIDKLREQGVDTEAGPVRRIGPLGEIYSLHLRDPDGNLIKLSNYLD